MKKKVLFVGTLVLVLAFGMIVMGCTDDTEEDVTVTFDANGGKWEDGSTTKSVKVPYDSDWNQVKVMVVNPTKTGSSFKEWSPVPNPDSGTVYVIGSFNRDKTIYALWQ